MNNTTELKDIEQQKRELTERQRELRDQLKETAEQRKAVRATRAQCRKDFIVEKTELHKHTKEIYQAFSKGSNEEISQLADNIVESATTLAATVRKFAEAVVE